MARMKKTSKIITAARERLAGLKSIDPELDLGNGMTARNFETKIDTAETKLGTYNTTLSTADEQLGLFEVSEDDQKDFHERMLLAVATKYGKDSIEYEQAGGTRKSEIRRKPKPKTPPTS